MSRLQSRREIETKIKGVGYKKVEMIVSTQTGFNGQKLVEKESGSGNVITEKTELEAERQLNRDYTVIDGNCQWPTEAKCHMDYINFTKEPSSSTCPHRTRLEHMTRSGWRSYACRTTE